MVQVAHRFFITICAASDSGGMEIIMKNDKLKQLWKMEEQHAFKGWDFSYINGRWSRIFINPESSL